MDHPIEVVATEAQGTTVVFSWDGRVLEVFNWLARSALRFHVADVDLEIGEPNRKGRSEVRVGWSPSADEGERRFQRGSFSWEFEAAELERVRPLLDRVLQARPAAAQ